MTYPLVLISPDNSIPQLICSAEDLPQRAPDILKDKTHWLRARFHSLSHRFGIADITADHSPGLLANLLHGQDSAWWNLRIELTPAIPADTEELRSALLQAIAKDDDCLTQFYSAPCLEYLLQRCSSVAELIVTGCLTGCLPHLGPQAARLPALHEGTDDYDEEDYEDSNTTPADLQHYSSPGYTGPLSQDNIRRLAETLHQSPFDWQFLSPQHQ